MKFNSVITKLFLVLVICMFIVILIFHVLIKKVNEDIIVNQIENDVRDMFQINIGNNYDINKIKIESENIYKLDSISSVKILDESNIMIFSLSDSYSNRIISITFENGGYEVLFTMDTKYILERVHKYNRKIIYIIDFSLIIILFIILIALDIIVIRPLMKFKKIATEVTKNNYHSKLEISRNDEFGDVATSYNIMLSNVVKLMQMLDEKTQKAKNDSDDKMNFLANMSHEIRTPLNSIIGFSSLLLEKKEFEDDKKELNIIISSGKHLQNVIDDILNITKLEQHHIILEKMTFSIRMLMNEINDMFQIDMENKNLEYTSSIDNDVPSLIIGDEYRIKGIIINLLSNAIKFTKEGSIKVNIKSQDSKLIIYIKDTGVGISQENSSTIFDVYSQSDKSTYRLYGGTGLGLAISREISELMGGNITFTSKLNKGSTFKVEIKYENVYDFELLESMKGKLLVEKWLGKDSSIRDIILDFIKTLPSRIDNLLVSINNYEELEFKVHSLKGVTSHFNIIDINDILVELDNLMRDNLDIPNNIDMYMAKLKNIISLIPKEYLGGFKEIKIKKIIGKDIEFNILLAEDVPENTMLMCKILEKSNVAIDCASDGNQVIALLCKKKYDCLILDIEMPVLSGLDVLIWLKNNANKRADYIIALTANARNEDMNLYLELGSDWYLSKPIEKELLREKIEELKKLKKDLTSYA